VQAILTSPPGMVNLIPPPMMMSPMGGSGMTPTGASGHYFHNHPNMPSGGGTTLRGQKRIIESNHSEPFIVITNTKQWGEAEGILLKKRHF